MTDQPAAQPPQLIVLAGGNGAGKSTFYRTRLKPRGIPFINADVIAREYWPDTAEQHSYEAMILAEQTRREALLRGVSFCFETVFSHPSKRQFLREAKAAGFQLHLIFIHLEHSDLNVLRVQQRLLEGGHRVPEAKIRSRLQRTVNNLKEALTIPDSVTLIDNSRFDDPFRVQGRYQNRQWTHLAEQPTRWARQLIRH